MVQWDQWHLCSAWTQVWSPFLNGGWKNLALPQLPHKSQLQLGSDPWLQNSICLRVTKKKKEEEEEEEEKNTNNSDKLRRRCTVFSHGNKWSPEPILNFSGYDNSSWLSFGKPADPLASQSAGEGGAHSRALRATSHQQSPQVTTCADGISAHKSLISLILELQMPWKPFIRATVCSALRDCAWPAFSHNFRFFFFFFFFSFSRAASCCIWRFPG